MTGSWDRIGQASQVQRLRAEITGGRVHHSYLITGPRGSGKAMLAETFAAAILCPNARGAGEACGTCDGCLRLKRGMHSDLDHYSLQRQRDEQSSKTRGTTLTVDTIRNISASASLKPFAGSHRVIIIDDAEAMQPEAQEAFLKTLEEPPSYLVLMLLADSSDSLKPTILSRCEQIELRSVSARALVEHLRQAGRRRSPSGSDCRDLVRESRMGARRAERTRNDRRPRA